MALEEKINGFHARLQGMLETLSDLHTTIVEYRPLPRDGAAHDTPVLVDILGNSVEDLIGWMMEALAASQATQAAARSGDMEAVRRSLAASHMPITRVVQCLVADLMPYERVADLARVGRTRGGEWRAWAMSVKQTLDGCRQPLFDVQQAQFECWQEVAERSGHQSISVQATGVGTIGSFPAPRVASHPLHTGEL
jgi:hypothetical protein